MEQTQLNWAQQMVRDGCSLDEVAIESERLNSVRPADEGDFLNVGISNDSHIQKQPYFVPWVMDDREPGGGEVVVIHR